MLLKPEGYEGQVIEILLFVTVLKTLDNRVIYIPNGPLAGGPIENYSKDEWRRVDMDFKIGAGQDIDTARKVMLDALSSVKGGHEFSGGTNCSHGSHGVCHSSSGTTLL